MYVVLSPLAKVAATVGMAGGGLVVYNRMSGATWAAMPGAVLLFGGALVYFVERIRLSMKKRDADGPDGPRSA